MICIFVYRTASNRRDFNKSGSIRVKSTHALVLQIALKNVKGQRYPFPSVYKTLSTEVIRNGHIMFTKFYTTHDVRLFKLNNKKFNLTRRLCKCFVIHSHGLH